jgi:hypothetical protein
MAMILRDFQMADYDGVVSLWAAAGLALGAADDREAVAAKLDRPPELFVVAEEAEGLWTVCWVRGTAAAGGSIPWRSCWEFRGAARDR